MARWLAPLVLILLAHGAPACDLTVLAADFGAYDVFSVAPTDGLGMVDIRCAADSKVKISLDPGTYSGGVFAPRLLQSSAAATTLNYNLYLDASRNRIWGDGTGNTDVYFGQAGPPSLSVPIYSRLPPGQRAAPGIYTDSVLLTIEW